MALDFYEERKWKKAWGFIFAQNAKKETEKKEKSNKINDLYKKCYSLYMAINQNHNASELLLYNINDRLDDYLKKNLNNDIENLSKDLYNWKKQIKDIETEIKGGIKIDDINEKKLSDIFSLIKSLINIQEEKIKIIYNNRNSNIQHIDPRNINDMTNLLKQSKQLNNVDNQNYIILSNKSDMNYNENNYNLKNIIDQINEEYNGNMINIEKVNIHNSNIIKGYNSPNQKNAQKSLKTIGNDSNNNSDIDMEIEDNINNELDPVNLFLDLSDGASHKNIVDYFKNNTNFGSCFSMPIFDLQKLMSNNYNLNKLEFDKKNIYYKMFPAIDNNENKISYEKIINEDTQLNINIFELTTRYDNLTPLQKLVIIYGIFTTGNNSSIIGFILNSYYPTRCIIYNIDEMNYITQKILDEIEIYYESNYTNSNNEIINFNNKKNYLGSTQILEIESVFNMHKFNEFQYINSIKIFMTCKNNDEYARYYIFKNIKNRVQKKNNKFNIYSKKISIQTSIFLMNIITHNPYIINDRIKKIIIKKIITYIKELCKVIKDIKNNNKSKFNYFIGKAINNTHKQINDINYEEIKENKNKPLNKKNILKSLREYRNEFKTYSIKQYKEEINEKNNIKSNIDNKLDKYSKTNILDVINKFSEYNINKEWKSLKNVWYQNNNRLSPLFKGNEPNTDYKNNYNNNILNKYNLNEKEEFIEFGSILNLNINQ